MQHGLNWPEPGFYQQAPKLQSKPTIIGFVLFSIKWYVIRVCNMV